MVSFIQHDIITAMGAAIDSRQGQFDILEHDGQFSVHSHEGPVATNLPDLESAYHVAFSAADEWAMNNAR